MQEVNCSYRVTWARSSSSSSTGAYRLSNRELRDLCCFLDSSASAGGVPRASGSSSGPGIPSRARGSRRLLAKLAVGRPPEELLRENLGAQGALSGAGREEVPLRRLRRLGGSGRWLTPELALPPCGPRDLGDGSSSTGSVGSPDQLPLACSPDD